MASKWQSASMVGEEFDRVFDEAFEDLLIRRWRRPVRVRDLGKALIVEDEENYRIKIAIPDANPQELEVAVSEWRLTVRNTITLGKGEETLDFAHRIDTQGVTARFAAGILEVFAPKARGRKIEVF
jgi:HSP20 family molecular chaperone IbpA